MEHREIRVVVPAVVANVGPGWNIFAYAVETPVYEIDVRLEKNGTVSCPDPRGEKVASAFLAHINSEEGCSVSIQNKIVPGSGLSTSDSVPLGILYALNNLFDSPLQPINLLQILKPEHPAMAAAALVGGFVLVRETDPIDIIEVPCQVELYTALVRPELELPEEIFNPQEIPPQKWYAQSGAIAAMTAGLTLGRDDLFSKAIRDELFEKRASAFIPGYAEVKKAALEAGALGAGIAGKGPTLFAISTTPKISTRVGQAMASAFQSQAINSQLYITKVNFRGVTPLL